MKNGKKLPEIINITPETIVSKTRKIDSNGNIIFNLNKEGLQIYDDNDLKIYGDNTVGLCDSTKMSEEDWKKGRHYAEIFGKSQILIGGSDAGIIKGVNKYSTEKELFDSYIDVSSEKDVPLDTEFLFSWGHTVESLIAQGFSAQTGLPVYKNSMRFYNRRNGFQIADVDFFTKTPDGKLWILEIKSTSPEGAKRWQDGVPPEYYAQAVEHYPRVLEDLNVAGTYFACSYNNRLSDMIIRKCPRDIEGEKELESLEAEFINYVRNKQTPPYRSIEGPSAVEALRKQYPLADDKEIRKLDSSLAESIEKYLAIDEERKSYEGYARKLKSEQEKIKVPIMSAMQNSEKGKIVISDKNYIINMSNNNPRISIPTSEIKKLLEEFPDAEKYVNTTISRKFSIKEEKISKKDVK